MLLVSQGAERGWRRIGSRDRGLPASAGGMGVRRCNAWITKCKLWLTSVGISTLSRSALRHRAPTRNRLTTSVGTSSSSRSTWATRPSGPKAAGIAGWPTASVPRYSRSALNTSIGPSSSHGSSPRRWIHSPPSQVTAIPRTTGTSWWNVRSRILWRLSSGSRGGKSPAEEEPPANRSSRWRRWEAIVLCRMRCDTGSGESGRVSTSSSDPSGRASLIA